MRRAVCILLIGLVGCNGVSHFHAVQSTQTFIAVTGFVSSIQLTSVPNNGIFIDVTTVTFLHNGSSSTVTFCGDLVHEFFLGAFVQVDFFSGVPCSTVVNVFVN